MAHAEGCRGSPWISAYLSIPILRRAWRLATKYQHEDCFDCHCSHGRQRPVVHLDDIVYPQSPYQNSFSGLFWHLIQTFRGRRFRDHGFNGDVKSVSTSMTHGLMQLAMEETVARKERDVRVTQWLIDNLTEDAEMEKLLSAIPGSFSTDWGAVVWRRVDEHHESEV